MSDLQHCHEHREILQRRRSFQWINVIYKLERLGPIVFAIRDFSPATIITSSSAAATNSTRAPSETKSKYSRLPSRPATTGGAEKRTGSAADRAREQQGAQRVPLPARKCGQPGAEVVQFVSAQTNVHFGPNDRLRGDRGGDGETAKDLCRVTDR